MFKTGYQRKEVPTLVTKKTVSFTKTITKKMFGKEMKFYSSNSTIVEYEGGYLFNLRWINYSYNVDGSIREWPDQIFNLTSRYKLDKDFNQITDEVFLEEEEKIHSWGSFGLEDFRIFQMKDEYYYIASCNDENRKLISMSSGIYDMNHFKLPVQQITPSFYGEENKRHEKNWSFVLYKNKMALVYQWYPLQLTEIDYDTKQLNRLTTKPMPDFFKEARGSSTGYTKNKEIWFVLHKKQRLFKNNRACLEYQDCFAIFDLDMNLLRYSEWFKLGNHSVEFCIGLIITDIEVILSYSLSDTQSFVSVYDANSLRRLKWHSVR